MNNTKIDWKYLLIKNETAQKLNNKNQQPKFLLNRIKQNLSDLHNISQAQSLK